MRFTEQHLRSLDSDLSLALALGRSRLRLHPTLLRFRVPIGGLYEDFGQPLFDLRTYAITPRSSSTIPV